MKELVIKPSSGRSILLALACIAFTIAGLAMLFADDIGTKIMGFLAIAFFGGGGVFTLIRQMKGGTTLTLTPEGIVPGSGGFVPWQNVGRIAATTTGGAAALGVEVLDVPAYVATLTPEQQRLVGRTAKAGRAFGAATGTPELLGLPTDDVVAAAHWGAEQSGGYHLTFPALSLNKPIKTLVGVLESYRSSAMGSRG